MITFTIGVICIIAVVIVLALLWCGGNWTSSRILSNLLKTLALRNWLPQFITILTAILRFVISAHILICCMMVASLAISRNAIRQVEDQHYVTVLQEAGPGPTAMFLPFARAARHGRFVIGFLSVCMMILISTLLQFASTMLLSDFSSALLPGSSSNLVVNMTTGNFDIDNSLTQSRPVAYPVFAERSEGRNKILPEGSERGLMDTGNVSRAYMALSAEDRVRVRSYQGFGTVLTTHFICFPPDLSNTSVIDLYHNTSMYTPGSIYDPASSNASDTSVAFALSGTIPPPSSTLYEEYNSGGRSFNFNRLSAFNNTGAEVDACGPIRLYSLNFCTLFNYPWRGEGDFFDNDTGDIDDPDAEWFLVTRMFVPQSATSANLSSAFHHGPVFQFEGAEWVNQTYSDGTTSFTLSHSLCVSRAIYTWADTKIQTSIEREMKIWKEPEVARSTNHKYDEDNTYDISEVQRQFGVDSEISKALDEREILTLVSDVDIRNRSAFINASISIGNLLGNFNNIETSKCIPSIAWQHHEPKVYYYSLCGQSIVEDLIAQQLFLNVLETSRSLALAFESLATFIFLAIYTPYSTKSDLVNGNDSPKYVDVSFTEERLVPRRFVGFGLVMGLVTSHIFLVGIIVFVFLRRKLLIRLPLSSPTVINHSD
jgi:hypothetical protein